MNRKMMLVTLWCCISFVFLILCVNGIVQKERKRKVVNIPKVKVTGQPITLMPGESMQLSFSFEEPSEEEASDNSQEGDLTTGGTLSGYFNIIEDPLRTNLYRERPFMLERPGLVFFFSGALRGGDYMILHNVPSSSEFIGNIPLVKEVYCSISNKEELIEKFDITFGEDFSCDEFIIKGDV